MNAFPRAGREDGRKAKILQVAQLGRPVVRQKAKPVKDVADPRIQELIEDLIVTCDASDGVGIAAPQVYESLRLFIVWSRANARYSKIPEMKPLPVINPEMKAKSKRLEKGWEGCLSLPGIRGLVPRHRSIEIEYTDREGKAQRKRFSGFVARIFQHEFDHLNGKLFIDRTKTADMISEKEYLLMMRKKRPKQ